MRLSGIEIWRVWCLREISHLGPLPLGVSANVLCIGI